MKLAGRVCVQTVTPTAKTTSTAQVVYNSLSSTKDAQYAVHSMTPDELKLLRFKHVEQPLNMRAMRSREASSGDVREDCFSSHSALFVYTRLLVEMEGTM